MKPEQQQKSNTALREEAILAFWKENGIFEKTLAKESPKGEFVFYEGPPTANAKPALHHLEARAFKDVLPRYKTMQGFHVRRRAGWDTHGLPVELQIEKKLGLKSKKEIEQYGIAAFNTACKESVFTYIMDWEAFTERIGYWVDKEHAYYTFDTPYIESLWNILATVHERGLLYKDYKVIPWCPRCGTALSSHELAQPGAYTDVKDLSVTAKFKVVGEEQTFILAWTTTPWTLPGNVGLAVGNDIEYVKVKNGDEYLILAKERLEMFPETPEIVETCTGSDLVGLSYEPLYPYLRSALLDARSQSLDAAFKVYAAEFVTTVDGTGIVHIAVMYGADDFELGTNVGLPKFHTVTPEGTFIAGTDFLAGRFVKDEDVAVDIIKDLAHRGLLFKKEKYEHPYPHCWRCGTPLLYYARDSWYIAMSKLRENLVNENETINWEPAHIRDGRFGEWLREIKDWAISRERYWGTPLPIWESADGERLVVDSISTLKTYAKKSSNHYFVMRHGQTENNVAGVWCCDSHLADPLTPEGKLQVQENAEQLKAEHIDLIVTSPFSRTQETAEMVATVLGIEKEAIISDPRIGEWNVGAEYDKKPLSVFFEARNKETDRYHFKTTDGESYAEVLARCGEFLYDIEQKYSGKKILIISHGAAVRAMTIIAEGFSYKTLYQQTRSFQNFGNAEVRPLSFAALPHNEAFETDLHRPYIDEVVLEKDGKAFHRIKEVMDVWFDSGSMPFAQDHYPFENKAWVEGKGYPADFISEAIDQTRGWFYTLHAIGVLMGRGKAYKNVICLGHILDAEGKKMSKSLGNTVDPWEEMSKYGVDTLRLWMFAVNQPGDSKNYDEKTVLELNRQVFGLLYNVLSFYELYRDQNVESGEGKGESANVLDQWIHARLQQVVSEVTASLDAYKLMEPVRTIRLFIDDLSTWYLRRSRDRIKDGDPQAKQTLYYVLKTLAVVMAPFAPFAAEDIWQKLRTENEEESVHLVSWINTEPINSAVIEQMEIVRAVCTLGNAERKKLAIPVRQPLSELKVESGKLKVDDTYAALICEELNVKAVVFSEEITGVAFNTMINPELKREGEYRELIREVQDLRKAQGLSPGDIVSIELPEGKREIVEPFMEEFKKTVQVTEVTFGNSEIKITS